MILPTLAPLPAWASSPPSQIMASPKGKAMIRYAFP